MLSGVGDPEHLRALELTVHAESLQVGQNLMDHLEVYVQQACVQPVSLYPHLSLWGRAKVGLKWLLTREGLGATNHFEAGGFIRSDGTRDYPDIQFHFLPAAMSYDGVNQARQHGFQAHVGPMLSPSRGRITLTSSDPLAAPRIRFNYMSHDSDWRTFRSAIRKTREIFAAPALKDFAGAELAPGPALKSDKALDDFVRENAESAYHPCGTCRMGAPHNSVVDSAARVYGIEGLRVVDASIFPHITNGNLNAPTIMVAERVADLIRGRVLPPDVHQAHATEGDQT